MWLHHDAVCESKMQSFMACHGISAYRGTPCLVYGVSGFCSCQTVFYELLYVMSCLWVLSSCGAMHCSLLERGLK